MPVISKLKTRGGRVETRVTGPQVDMRGVGAIAQSISNIGGAVKTTALQVGQVLHREEVLNFTDSKKLEFEKGVRTKEEELKEKYRGSDHKEYVKELQGYMDGAREEMLDTAPSSDAKNSFQRNSKGFYDRTVSKNNAYAIGESYNYSKNLDMGLNDELGQQAYNSPSIEEVDDDLLDRLQKIKSHEGFRYNNKQINDLMDDARKKSREGILSGLEKNGSFQEGLDQLQIESETMEGITPSERRKWQKRMESGQKTQKTQVSKQLVGDVNNISSIMSNGGEVSNTELSSIRSRIDLEADPKKRDAMRAKVFEVDSYNKIMDAVGLVPSNEIDWDKAVNDSLEDTTFEDDLAGRAVKAEVKANAMKSTKKIHDKAIGPKSADYFSERDTTIASDLAMAIAGDPDAYERAMNGINSYQDRFGTPKSNRKPPKYIKETYGTGLKSALDSGNIEAATATLDAMESMTRTNSAPLMRELGIDPKYSILGEVGQDGTANGKALRERALNNFTQSKEIKETFKGAGNEDNYLKDNEIDEKLIDSDIYQAMISQGGRNSQAMLNASAALDTVRLEYKRRIIAGDKPEDAQREAWDLFGSSSNVIQGDNTKPIAVPKKFNGQGISEYLDSTLTNRNFILDDDYSIVDQFDIKVEPGLTKENYDSADYEWVGTRDGNGVQLMGRGQGIVRNNKGERIELTFEEVQNLSPVDRKGTVEEIKGLKVTNRDKIRAIWGR